LFLVFIETNILDTLRQGPKISHLVRLACIDLQPVKRVFQWYRGARVR
jgi:hypothetical protein